MLIPSRLRRKILPWLSTAAFVANFLRADAVLDDAWPALGSVSQESAHRRVESVSEEGYEPLTFGLASAQAASTGAKERGQVIDFFKMAMGGVAGLVLFIYGVTRLAESLEELSTERMRKFLSTATTNRFAGVFTGIVATTLLESSSVTIIMVIAMVSGGVLTFVQSLGVVLGSNIGTAVGAQIISLDIKHYVAVLMAVGVLVFLLGRTKTQKNLGLVVLGFGLMFYGLEAIDDAMRPFRTYQPFIDLMQTLGTNPRWDHFCPLLGAIRPGGIPWGGRGTSGGECPDPLQRHRSASHHRVFAGHRAWTRMDYPRYASGAAAVSRDHAGPDTNLTTVHCAKPSVLVTQASVPGDVGSIERVTGDTVPGGVVIAWVS